MPQSGNSLGLQPIQKVPGQPIFGALGTKCASLSWISAILNQTSASNPNNEDMKIRPYGKAASENHDHNEQLTSKIRKSNEQKQTFKEFAKRYNVHDDPRLIAMQIWECIHSSLMWSLHEWPLWLDIPAPQIYIRMVCSPLTDNGPTGCNGHYFFSHHRSSQEATCSGSLFWSFWNSVQIWLNLRPNKLFWNGFDCRRAKRYWRLLLVELQVKPVQYSWKDKRISGRCGQFDWMEFFACRAIEHFVWFCCSGLRAMLQGRQAFVCENPKDSLFWQVTPWVERDFQEHTFEQVHQAVHMAQNDLSG